MTPEVTQFGAHQIGEAFNVSFIPIFIIPHISGWS